jgi:hypothetical protein
MKQPTIGSAGSVTRTSLRPDLEEAERFLELLDPSGLFTFQTFDDNAERKDHRLARVVHGTFAQHAGALTALNQRGAGVFVMVNEGNGVPKAGKTCRSNANVVRVRRAFVDLDGAPLEPVLAAFTSPHVVVESSPGKWHAYYLIENCSLQEFGPVQRALAARFGGDPSVCDLARVMRLPGFWHQKAEPFMTRLAYSV